MTEPRVALVLVAHSGLLARGAAELAGQMAPDVRILPVGGAPGGGLGTDYDAARAAIEEAAGAAGAVAVFADLGSSVLTVEALLEEEDLAGPVRLADAPFVEGAVAGAVTAAGGGDLAAVLTSAAAARGGGFAGGDSGAGGATVPGARPGEDGAGPGSAEHACATATVRNPLGLHARPAATLARLVAGLDARITVGGVAGASVLELMQLETPVGRELAVEANGPGARQAVEAVVAVIEGGFGEI